MQVNDFLNFFIENPNIYIAGFFLNICIIKLSQVVNIITFLFTVDKLITLEAVIQYAIQEEGRDWQKDMVCRNYSGVGGTKQLLKTNYHLQLVIHMMACLFIPVHIVY